MMTPKRLVPMLRMLLNIVLLVVMVASAVLAKAYGIVGIAVFALVVAGLLALTLSAKRRNRPARIREGIGFVRPRHRS